MCAVALDRIRAGLAEGLAGRDVRRDGGRIERPERDLGRDHRRLGDRAARREQRDRRTHDVGPAREAPQHRSGVCSVTRLAEDRAVELDDRVGAEHPAGAKPERRPCFLVGHAARKRGWCLAGTGAFVDVGREHDERDAERGEQMAAARRRRGENE